MERGSVSGVYLYTSARGYWGQRTKDGELVESLYETIHRALNDDDLSETEGTPADCTVARNPRFEAPSYDLHDGVLSVPRIEDVRARVSGAACGADENFHVAVKFFFYGSRSRDNAACQYCPSWVADALEKIAYLAHTRRVDTLVLAFPELAQTLDADDSVPDEDTTQCIRRIWNRLGGYAEVQELGVADLGRPALERVYAHVDPSVKGTADTRSVFADPKTVSSGVRNGACSPKEDQLTWTRRRGGALVAHSDPACGCARWPRLTPGMLTSDTLKDIAKILPHVNEATLRLQWIARVRRAKRRI